MDNKIPKKIWNEYSEQYKIKSLTQLPVGYRNRNCPKCNSRNIIGAIICYNDNTKVTRSTDDYDPNILCLDCGYWADSFPAQPS